jgi:hypothetical protein
VTTIIIFVKKMGKKESAELPVSVCFCTLNYIVKQASAKYINKSSIFYKLLKGNIIILKGNVELEPFKLRRVRIVATIQGSQNIYIYILGQTMLYLYK